MKLIYKLVIVFTIIASVQRVIAQDSLYIYKDGVVIDKHELAEIDSVIFYKAEVPKDNTVTDVEGNVYNTVVIGSQTWMAENLKTTKYANGDEIGTTSSSTIDISGEYMPKYQWAYNGDENNVATYGRLYTWYAANDSRNLCPIGWHLPTDTEWNTLKDYLMENGYSYDGKIGRNTIAKSLATDYGWMPSDKTGAVGNTDYPSYRNKTGFAGLPSGLRYHTGEYKLITEICSWWSASVFGINAYYHGLYKSHGYLSYSNIGKNYGHSIRCIKD